MDTTLLARRVVLDECREPHPIDECDVLDFLKLLLRNHGEAASFASEAISEMSDAKLVGLVEDAIDIRPTMTAAMAVRAYARRILEREAAEQEVDTVSDPFDEPAADNRSRALDVQSELNYLFREVL